MPELDIITQWVVTLLPSFITILGSISVVVKALSTFKKIKEDVTVRDEYIEMKAQLKLSVQQNYELKKQINELLTAIDKVKRG